MFKKYIPSRALKNGRTASEPFVRITKKGLLTFSKNAVLQHELTKFRGVILHFDPKRRRIGFQFVNDLNDKGAFSLFYLSEFMLGASAISFTNCFSIPRNIRMPLHRDEKLGMLTCNLPKGD